MILGWNKTASGGGGRTSSKLVACQLARTMSSLVTWWTLHGLNKREGKVGSGGTSVLARQPPS